MSQGNYWETFRNSRLSRRRALAGSAALGASAAFLAACGGGDGDSAGGGADKSGLVSKPIDTVTSAKAGGVLKHFAVGDALHLDPLTSSNANVVNYVAPYAYPRLVKWQAGKYPEVADGKPEGFAAESFEISPDKLQLTFKLRQNMKWDSRAPTSGRALDAQDVLFSWNKFAKVNNLRSNLVYDANTAKDAAVESVTAPDSRTIVMKLRQPDYRVIAFLAAYDYLNIMPRESESGFDPRSVVRGHGPWMLEEYNPSVRFVWAKNPDYYVKDRPFPDKVEVPILPDYAQRLAQFKAGNIYTNVPTPEDVIQTKKDAPKTIMLQGDRFVTAGGGYVTFGWETGSPWADVRMRQAVSMSIDREAYADTMENRDAYAKEGIDLPVAFNSIIYAGWTGAYLDPNNDKEFGPNNKYLKMNIAEAKKLISAAGHPNGIEFDWKFSTEQYGAAYLKSVQILAGMFPEAGLKPKQVAYPYNTFSQLYNGETYWNFGGVIHRAGRQWPALASMLFAFMNPGGTNYHGASTDGRNVDKGDAKLNDLLSKLTGEFDINKQNALAHEIIRYYTQQTYSISRPSNTKGYTMAWPAIGNYGLNSTFVGGAVTEPWLNWWIDPSKAPLAKT
ncbi:MAG TPA: ABC transporter substrate-binding protein [Dehalococcoidia bacterium]|nr:ABC transporter substrate-binding protein [Dehalococcoidia bacterium]